MFSIRNLSRVKLWVKITVSVVLLALVGWPVWVFVVTPLTSCGPDVERIAGQCIGVTDGQAELNADLKDVLSKIRLENEHVADQPAVSVAYLVPLPIPSGNGMSAEATRLRHELEGAHIAQLQANHTATLGDGLKVRLLVANSGDQSSQWPRAVSKLLKMVDGPKPLVAVVATGKTLSGTIDSIDALRSGGVPVVASRLAGDRLTNLSPEELATVRGGLARLAPTGKDQAEAAAAYLKRGNAEGSQLSSKALIIRDVNPEDPYLESIENGFRNKFVDPGHAVLEPSETYDSRLGGVASSMIGILQNICIQRPDVVFFAGRSSALESFVQVLPRRPCPDLSINVMGNGDTVDFSTTVAQGDPELVKELVKGLNANASVRYTGQAHPNAWKSPSDKFFQPAATSTLSSTFNSLFPGEMLEDSGAIIGYDAIVTTVTAIHPANDEPDLVSQAFKRLHGTKAVPGASGWISIDPLGPVNKAVFILQVMPDGLKFVELSSARGSPCVPETSLPPDTVSPIPAGTSSC